ncbi:hypothetical protein HYT18_00380 [Candidatus Microgenomates bacterium]|nr:hypothetical protein [Candidatus Microgenomates bacterium]
MLNAEPLPHIKDAILNLMNQKGFAPILIILLLATALLGGYFIYQRQIQSIQSQQIIQPSPSSNDTLKKTLIKNTDHPGKYTNKEYGYSFEFPKEWDLYTDYSKVTGNVLTLYHSQCQGEVYLPPAGKIPCTTITLPYYIGSTGWGYGNKKQTKETVYIKDNIQGIKTTFYYDDYILISWTFNIDIPNKCKEAGISALVAFANINENFAPGSLQTVDSIIKSLEFTPLKDITCL